MDIGFLTTTGNNFTTLVQTALWAVVIFVVAYIALSFIFGSEQQRDRTKRHLPWLLIGSAVIVFIPRIVSTLRWMIGG